MDLTTSNQLIWKCQTMIQEWIIEVLVHLVVSCQLFLSFYIPKVISSSDHRDFPMSNMFPLPHQINMNRPPPSMMQDNDMNHQRKTWMHNQGGSDQSMCDDGNMNQVSEAPSSLLGIAPPNFMPPNHRNFQSPGSFRGNHRNTSPYNINTMNNFRGGRGGIRPRGRGGFRGNFKSQGQW